MICNSYSLMEHTF